MEDKDDPNVSAVRGIKFISGGFSVERERGHKAGRHCDIKTFYKTMFSYS